MEETFLNVIIIDLPRLPRFHALHKPDKDYTSLALFKRSY